MSATRWIGSRGVSGVLALCLCAAAVVARAGQDAAAPKPRADDVNGFTEFSARVKDYVRLQKKVESTLPDMKSTDVPEMITAHQQALARKIREARPHAKAGDVFTDSARESFRHAGRAALDGPHAAATRKYMEQPGAANPAMRLSVNSVYPDAEPVTPLPPALLAAFPALPDEVAYRVVGRAVVLVDVKSRLIVDFAREILKPPGK
jgi:hypothetical protein